MTVFIPIYVTAMVVNDNDNCSIAVCTVLDPTVVGTPRAIKWLSVYGADRSLMDADISGRAWAEWPAQRWHPEHTLDLYPLARRVPRFCNGLCLVKE